MLHASAQAPAAMAASPPVPHRYPNAMAAGDVDPSLPGNGDPISEEEALRRLRLSDDPSAQYYAAWWLGRNRSSHPDAVPLLQEALAAMGVVTLTKEDYEADDILAIKTAVKICLSCPIRGFCLEEGWSDKWGIWGSFTAAERERLRKAFRIPTINKEKRKVIRVIAHRL